MSQCQIHSGGLLQFIIIALRSPPGLLVWASMSISYDGIYCYYRIYVFL